MKIRTDDLRSICGRLLDHLERQAGPVVDVDHDHYWNIPKDHRYDRYQDPDPKELDIGQLSEDWSRLKGIQDDEDPPISYALVWLAAVLRAIGETVVR